MHDRVWWFFLIYKGPGIPKAIFLRCSRLCSIQRGMSEVSTTLQSYNINYFSCLEENLSLASTHLNGSHTLIHFKLYTSGSSLNRFSVHKYIRIHLGYEISLCWKELSRKKLKSQKDKLAILAGRHDSFTRRQGVFSFTSALYYIYTSALSDFAIPL
jgi:hypothetical protein